AGAGLGEVAGVAFERAAADAGAAEEEVLAAGLGDLGQEAGGVVGEAVADGKELEGVALGGEGGRRQEGQRDREDQAGETRGDGGHGRETLPCQRGVRQRRGRAVGQSGTARTMWSG